MVNCGPAKCCVPPVLAPAEGLVRAGAVLRGGGIRDWGRGGLPSFTPGLAVLLRCFAVGSRLSFFLCQEKRDGLRYLAFLFRRVEIAIRAFSRHSSVICLCGFTSGLRVFLWRSRQRTKGRGERSRRRGACALLRRRIGLDMLSAGSTLGLRAPNLRQRVFDSLDSLHAAAGLC